jgi:hypothetical protein
VKLNLKILTTLLIIVILLLSSIYIIYFPNDDNSDNERPSIGDVTGDISGKKGEVITIYATFSDNIEVTKAKLYYRTNTDTEWISKSILSGKVDISLDSNNNIYYYITVDDAAGNGPVGKPSNDGSTYFTISVFEDDGDDEYVRNVFIEEGSFTTCTYCPIVAEILYELYTSGDYNFYFVTLIRSNEKAVDRLDNEYNIYGLPTVYVDGGYKVLLGGGHEKSEYAQAIRDAEYRNTPDIRLTLEAKYDNNTDRLICNVLIDNKEDETYNGRLRVYLTEKISRWSGPKGEPYHFGFLDYLTNQEISINKNANTTFNETRDISKMDPENLMVIAAVFNSEKHQTYSNPTDKKNRFDAYYADAAEGSELIEGGNLPPTVGISLPETGKLHLLGKPIYEFRLLDNTILIGKSKIVAEAEDDSGIEKVEFYIDGNLVGEDTEEPFEYSFRKIKLLKRFVRKHTINVIAYDDEGKTGTSESIEVITFFL